MHVKADTDAIAAMGRALSSSAAALSADLDALASASRTLQGEWAGEAQTAFVGRHAQTDVSLRQTAASLSSAGARAVQYAEDLAAADVDGARAVIGF